MVSDGVLVYADIKKSAETKYGFIYIGMSFANLKNIYKNLKTRNQYNEPAGMMQREYIIESVDKKTALKFIEWEKTRKGNIIVYNGVIARIIAGLTDGLGIGEDTL